MGHGYPDYGMAAVMQNLYTVLDLGEAVARLGAPSVFNRLGSVLYQDSFAEGMQRWGLTAETGNEYSRVLAGRGRSDGYCCELWGKVGAVRLPYISKRVYFAHPGRCGLEVSLSAWQAIDYVDVRFDGLHDLHAYEVVVRWYPFGQVLQYSVDLVAFVDLDTALSIQQGYEEWVTIKVVVDIAEGVLERVLLNGVTYKVGVAATDFGASAGQERLYVVVQAVTTGAESCSCLVDDVIVTELEP